MTRKVWLTEIYAFLFVLEYISLNLFQEQHLAHQIQPPAVPKMKTLTLEDSCIKYSTIWSKCLLVKLPSSYPY